MVGRSQTHHQPKLAGEGRGHTHTHSSRQFGLVPCCQYFQLSYIYQLCSLSTLVVQGTVWQMHLYCAANVQLKMDPLLVKIISGIIVCWPYISSKSPIKSASSANLSLVMNPSVQLPALSPKERTFMLLHLMIESLPDLPLTSTVTNGRSLPTPPSSSEISSYW